jgi:Flp pilus assembly protein CpaB
MQKNKFLIPALIVFGVLAIGLTAMSMMGGNRTPAPEAPVTEVSTQAPAAAPAKQIVAQNAIPPRTVITRAMVNEEEGSSTQPGAFSSINDVVGKLSSMPIDAGQNITSSMVTLPIQRQIPAGFAVPAGLRAIAVYVDPAQTAAGLVDKGDRVDVLATYKLTFEKQDTDYYTQVMTGSKNYTLGRTVAQDLLVLGVDRSLLAPLPTPTPAEGQTTTVGAGKTAEATPTPTPGAGPQRVRVLLAATPAVCERLVAANDAGTLHLTIRNPTSREQAPLSDARESPIRVINVRKKTERANNTSSAPATAPLFPSSRDRDMAMAPYMPSPRQAPAPAPRIPPVQIPSGNRLPPQMMLPPAQPQSQERKSSPVTIIRGTDKTDLNVPTSP